MSDVTPGIRDHRGAPETLIPETPDNPGGPLVFGPKHPFEPIKTTTSFYRWPLETRESFFATTARLHAKCVIADHSSNIELGVLIEAGPLPERLSRHLALLIETGILDPVSAFADGVS